MIEKLGIRSGFHVLDVGCGTGDLTKELAKKTGHDGEVFALDPDSARLALAREQVKGTNISWVEGTIQEHSLPEAVFDIAFSNYVFHWFDKFKQETGLKRVHNSLKPGGKFGFTVIGRVPLVIQGVTRMIGAEANGDS